MSAADAVKLLEQQLEELKKKVAEEEREARRKTEEAERQRQQEEERAKREREKKEKAKKEQARKRKAPESDASLDSDAEVQEKAGKSGKADLIYPRRGCEKCREKGLECAFRPGKRTSTCVQCQHAKTGPCIGVKGLPDPELQARMDRKAVATPVESPRKRARNSTRRNTPPPTTPTRKPAKKADKARSLGKSTEKAKEKGKGKEAARTPSPGLGGPEADKKKKKAAPEAGPPALALATSGREWSVDPMQLSDRELLEHLLVEGQRNRQALNRVYKYLDEEIQVRDDLMSEDLREIRAAVRASMQLEVNKIKETVRAVVREEMAKALAAFGGEGAGSGSGSGAEVEKAVKVEKEGEGSGVDGQEKEQGEGEKEKEGEGEEMEVAAPE
ncbi:hypothetical protein FKP32DRAFT_1675155 [Trametes sanguinea]|nr:hypothetical protein FKP32DRAFT_1675155 [Trametes sanguinea]